MYGLALGRAGAEQPNSIQNAALGILRSYGTNAHVYLPGANGVAISGLSSGNYTDQTLTTYAAVDGTVGGVVDPLGAINATQSTGANRPRLNRGLYNLSVESDNFGGSATSFVNASYSGGKLLDSAISGQHRMDRAMTSAAGPQTFLALVKYGDYQWVSIRIGSNGASFDLVNGVVGTVVTGAGASRSIANAGNGYYLLAFSDPAALANTTCRVNNENADSVGTNFAGTGALGTYVSCVGLVAGTLTAAQILKKGGIPLTTSVAASNPGAGPYLWDTTGGKSLGMTFDASWTSATIIDAAPTGQSTLTAQNIVGAYSISTNTSGRIFINGSLSAADLATLQSFANMIAAA